jgi:hypothetical protein
MSFGIEIPTNRLSHYLDDARYDDNGTPKDR